MNSSKLHRLEPVKGTFAAEWTKWEKQLCNTLAANSEYLNSIQVPFESAVQQVQGELKRIAKGEYKPPSSENIKHRGETAASISGATWQQTSALDGMRVRRNNLWCSSPL